MTMTVVVHHQVHLCDLFFVIFTKCQKVNKIYYADFFLGINIFALEIFTKKVAIEK